MKQIENFAQNYVRYAVSPKLITSRHELSKGDISSFRMTANYTKSQICTAYTEFVTIMNTKPETGSEIIPYRIKIKTIFRKIKAKGNMK